MRNDRFRILTVAALLFTVSVGCNNQGKFGVVANTNSTGQVDGASANVVPASEKDPSTNSVPAGEPEEAMILLPVKEVSIKVKGAKTFIRITDSTLFRSGDTLQIGADSKAVIHCRDVCALTTETYTACCTDACKVLASLTRGAAAGSPLMFKKDLTPDEALTLADSESKLQGLGLGPTTTRFLKASLYSSWRLKEAEAELSALSEQLKKPESAAELDKIYTTVTRRTGDLFLTIDKEDSARLEYEKTIVRATQAAGGQPSRLDEKAIAHSRLAGIYAGNGNKAKAEANFKAARSIYLMRGETAKAEALDRKMKHQ